MAAQQSHKPIDDECWYSQADWAKKTQAGTQLVPQPGDTSKCLHYSVSLKATGGRKTRLLFRDGLKTENQESHWD